MVDDRYSIPVEQLRLAVEQLYSTFAAYTLKPNIEGCEHCVSPEEQAIWYSKPLRELTEEDLTSYAYSAIITFGDGTDLRYFLPRLLELMAFYPEWFVDDEIVLGKLRHADWHDWPNTEQQAIRDYLKALWRLELATLPGTGYSAAVDECLCGIAQAVDDLSSYLAFWHVELKSSLLPAVHLAIFITYNADSLLKEQNLSNAFWEERHKQMVQVVDWLRDSSTADKFKLASVPFRAGVFVPQFSQTTEEYMGRSISGVFSTALATLEEMRK